MHVSERNHISFSISEKQNYTRLGNAICITLLVITIIAALVALFFGVASIIGLKTGWPHFFEAIGERLSMYGAIALTCMGGSLIVLSGIALLCYLSPKSPPEEQLEQSPSNEKFGLKVFKEEGCNVFQFEEPSTPYRLNSGMIAAHHFPGVYAIIKNNTSRNLTEVQIGFEDIITLPPGSYCIRQYYPPNG